MQISMHIFDGARYAFKTSVSLLFSIVKAWFAWADPALPALPGDPYQEPLTGEAIREMLAR